MGRWVMRPLHYERPEYDAGPTGKLFTIELHYGGVLIGNAYRYGHVSYMDMVDPDKLSLHELNRMVEFVGVYGGIFEYLWMVPGEKIPAGLKALHCDVDVRSLIDGVTALKTICVYVNKLTEFQARRRLAQIQLQMFEEVRQRRDVVIQEVDEVGHANNHLLALEYNIGQAPVAPTSPPVHSPTPSVLNTTPPPSPNKACSPNPPRNCPTPPPSPHTKGPTPSPSPPVGEFETTKKDKRGKTYQSIKKRGQKQHCSVCNKEGHNKRVHGQEASNNGAGPSTVNSSGQASVSSPRVGTHVSGLTFVPTPTVRVTRSKMAALRAGHQV
ncbi:hypothetical protein LINPERPRIM_LOCUS9095 [Linum perenne]